MQCTQAWALALALFISPACESMKADSLQDSRVEFDGLSFRPHSQWVAGTPSSNMRVAQYTLEGATEDAELVVYYFGGGGGSIEANMERWCSQFEQADGSSTRDAAKIEETEHSELTFHTLDVSGRYVAETSPGSGEHVDRPEMRMLGAIVETSSGPYYVKLVGRAVTVAEWSESFDSFLASMRP